MSNVIKSRYVYLNDGNKKIIDSNERAEQFRVLHYQKESMDEMAVTNEDYTVNTDSTGFIEGLKVEVIDSAFIEDDNNLKKSEEQILLEAQQKADQIIEEAYKKAKVTCEALYEEARSKGYEEGLKSGNREVELIKVKLEELSDKQKKEYQEKIEALEPEFANLVAHLVEKVIGIHIEENIDVIGYILHNTILHLDKSKTYNIRVSKEDYDLVIDKKDEIFSLINNTEDIDIVLDNDLCKNQCFIETDTSIIDCSLDTQLSNLIKDIKLLATI